MRLDHLLSKVYEEKIKGSIEQGPRHSAVLFHGLKNAMIRAHHGGVAQLGEHLPCKQGVSGSIPLISTKCEMRDERPVAASGG